MLTKVREYIPLSLICIGAFLLRVLWQWDKVFVDGDVWYRGVDSWYHMRLTDAMMENFPFPLRADIYAQYPNGAEVGYLPFLQWVIAAVGQVFDYEIVGALLPPIIGMLTLIPIYLICKILFDRRVGLLACILIAVLPGEFFHRSLLGFTDHHILETFLMVSTLLFLLLDYKHNKWVWRLLAGVFLGFYMLNWAGGAFFLLILGVWVWIEALRDKLTMHHVKVISVPAAIAFAMSYELLNREALVASVLLIGAPIMVVCWRRIVKYKWVALVPILVIPCYLFWDYSQQVRDIFWGGHTYIAEASPINATILMRTYGISLFLGLAGVYFYIRSKGNTLFLIWAIVLVVVTIGQRRWGYYTTIPVAIFASYFVFHLVGYVRKETRIVAVIMISFFLILPMVNQISRMVSLPNNITPAWYSSLTWLKENSPEPLPKGSYYRLNPNHKAEYGILAWWDYGNWIIRIPQRVPQSSPTLAHWIPARFFTSQSVEEGIKALEGNNYQYIIIDETLLTGKWYAIVERAGYPPEREQDLLPNSMLVRLWANQADGFRLVYQEGPVRIFEVIQPIGAER